MSLYIPDVFPSQLHAVTPCKNAIAMSCRMKCLQRPAHAKAKKKTKKCACVLRFARLITILVCPRCSAKLKSHRARCFICPCSPTPYCQECWEGTWCSDCGKHDCGNCDEHEDCEPESYDEKSETESEEEDEEEQQEGKKRKTEETEEEKKEESRPEKRVKPDPNASQE